ncbi:MAG: DUF6527 family protein [Caulobacter sp.]|nr:DUF6527 family protein [Caulobacter sp.]
MGALSPILRSIEGGRVMFFCPGCKSAHAIPVEGDRAWGYNGNSEKPTFTPSILVTHHHAVPPVTPENLDQFKAAPWAQTRVTDICHSFVTDGQIQFLGDCTHELAGQTVPLPNLEG